MTEPYLLEVFEKYLPGSDYIDIGPLFGTVNETLSIAARYNPKSLSAADIDPLDSDSWRALRDRLQALQVGDVREFSMNIDDPAIVEKIGQYDFVHSAGILYHVPSPIFTLEQYRRLTKKYFLLGTMVVPEKIENDQGTSDFSGGKLIFVPALGEKERGVLAAFYDRWGMQIHHINAVDSWPWRYNDGPSYGPWWWLYSPATCRRMVETAGFEIVSEASTWEGRHHYFFCERSS
jgi:hypothetical protein